jgi:serine phosphatase RsbU (regulator of sigma subunit)/putative methionine-R-sulfoxide reductase with GAF domain
MSNPFCSPAEAGDEPLEHEVEQNLLIQQALNAILRIALEPISLDEQMHRVLDLILKLPWLALEWKGCIFLADEGTKALLMKAQVGMPSGSLSTCARVPFGTCLCGQAVVAKEVVFASGLDARHTIRYPGMVPHGHDCVPICSGGRCLGLLALYVRDGHQRSPTEERFLRAVADVLAGIIEHERTQQRLQEQLSERQKAQRRLTAEHRVSRILAVSQTFNDAALEVVQALCECLDWDVGTVWRVDPKDNLLRCVEIWHRPGVEVAAFEELTRRRTFSPGVDMPGRVWAGAEPVWVPDVTAAVDLSRRQVAAQCGLHGAVGFPIRDGQVQGVLEFYSREMRQPDDDLIQMMSSIGSEITQFIERRQAQGELQRQAEDRRIARQIQQGLLPKALPTLPGFRIGGRSLSANEVGGDCFDFLPFSVEGQERLGVLLADACGHGIAAALLVAQTRAYLRALAMTYAEVDELLTLTNRRLTADLVTDHFVSLFLAQLDPRTRSLVYANAGHCPGYVLDRQGEVKTVLAGTGGLVGIDQASKYSAGPTIKLEPGELVFLYSDGIVEAMSRDGKFFGLERTLDLVRGHQHKTPDEIVDKLFDAVSAFSEGTIQDDLTAVILKVEGTVTDPLQPVSSP